MKNAMLSSRFGWLRRGLGAALDLLLPQRCPVCGAALQGGAGAALCPACFSGLRFSPLAPGGGEVGGAIRRRRFALVYGDVSAELIRRFKYADRPDIAGRLAVWMARAGAEVLAEADLLVPVPIHWTRLASRQYNQAAELARRLSALTGRPWDARALVRIRRTPPQARLGARARHANVAGAFAARPGHALAGKRVLLIDDVATTGATAEACAKALLAAGATSVDLLSAAAAIPGGT